MNPQEGSDQRTEADEGPGPRSPVPPPATRRGGGRKGRRRGGKGGRKKAKEFLDVAGEAFAHQMAISLWREAEALLDAAPSFEEGIRRLQEFRGFEHRGAFAPIWQKNWDEASGRMGSVSTPPERLEILRRAVTKSVEEEDEARIQAGQPSIVDEKEGQNFIDFALGRLFKEAGGEIEEDI